MTKSLTFLAVVALLLNLQLPAVGQQQINNDGFHRRNGQMHILRNGQLRPMTRDSRLPTGVLVTKDGFLVDANGRRTELREGQACDLMGNVVAIGTTPAGGLALGAPRANRNPARRASTGVPAAEDMREVLTDVFEGRQREEERDEEDGYEGQGYGKSWEKRQKQAEKWREHEKKREEKAREYYKKREEKRREGKEWDD